MAYKQNEIINILHIKKQKVNHWAIKEIRIIKTHRKN